MRPTSSPTLDNPALYTGKSNDFFSSPHTEASERLRWPTALILLVAGILCGTMCAFTPRFVEDWGFVNVWIQYSPDGGESFSWSAWADYIAEIRQNDNVRLSNIMAPIFSMFSPWHQLFPWLTGAVFSFIIYMIYRFCQGKGRSWVYVSIIWTMLMVFLPWRNNLYVSDYALNYIWSAGISMLTLWVSLPLLKPGAHTGRFFAALVLAVIAGWWHEGFALPVSCGMLAWALFNRFKISRLWTAVAILWMLAALTALICPGMLARIKSQAGVMAAQSTFSILIDLSLNIFTFCVIATAMFFRNCRQRMNSPVFIVFFIALLIGFSLSLIIEHSPRQTFWPQICSIVCLGIILRPRLEKFTMMKIGRLLAIVLAVLCTVQGIAACIWEKRLKDEHDYVLDRFYAGETTVFYDITQPEDVPEYTLRMPPLRGMWVCTYNWDCIDAYFGNGAHAAVPRSLRGVTEAGSRRIPGSVGAYATADALWTRRQIPQHPSGWLVTLEDGTPRIINGVSFRFSPDGADSLYYIKIYNVAPDRIRELNLLEQ